jgi:hypothetical protein
MSNTEDKTENKLSSIFEIQRSLFVIQKDTIDKLK